MNIAAIDETDFAGERWHAGQLLAFSALDGPTDYDLGLVGRTTVRPHGLQITAPGTLQISFRQPVAAAVVFAGDFFRCGEVVGAMLDAHHLLVAGDVAVSGPQDGQIRCRSDGGRLLVGVAGHFKPEWIGADLESAVTARASWLRSQGLPANLSGQTRKTLARALSFMKGQVYSPAGRIKHRWTTPDRWPHKDMWLWDTAFHAVGWRHVDPALAMEMIEAMFDLQRDDGFLTYRGSSHGSAAHLGEVMTQPPVLAYAVGKVYETTGDRAWVERLYPRLCAYVEWDLNHRDTDGGGLVEWYIEDEETCRSGESGMDNSPRFDSARQIDAVDFNSFLAAECRALAGFGTLLGKEEDARKWTARHQVFAETINGLMWSEKDHFYCDRDSQDGTVSPILSSAGFLPLYGGVATRERAASLAKHLSDPQTFATAVPVPSVAVRDVEHYAKDMWRGPVWINVNWMIAEGLENSGLEDEARALREASVAEIERTFERFGTFFEYFDDRREVEPPQLLRKGENAPEKNPYRQVIHDFGWTATLYVDLVHRLHADGGAR